MQWVVAACSGGLCAGVGFVLYYAVRLRGGLGVFGEAWNAATEGDLGLAVGLFGLMAGAGLAVGKLRQGWVGYTLAALGSAVAALAFLLVFFIRRGPEWTLAFQAALPEAFAFTGLGAAAGAVALASASRLR